LLKIKKQYLIILKKQMFNLPVDLINLLVLFVILVIEKEVSFRRYYVLVLNKRERMQTFIVKTFIRMVCACVCLPLFTISYHLLQLFILMLKITQFVRMLIDNKAQLIAVLLAVHQLLFLLFDYCL